MAAERKAYPLRLREDLYDALRRWAEDDMRSVNGQIEFLLQDALKRAGRLRSQPAGTTSGEVSGGTSGESPGGMAEDGDRTTG